VSRTKYIETIEKEADDSVLRHPVHLGSRVSRVFSRYPIR
jgi:hypothetical protein